MSRIRRPAVLFLAAFVAAPLLAQHKTQAPGPRCAQDCLPESSYLAVGFAGLDACGAAVGSHRAAQVVLEFFRRIPKATFEEHVNVGLEQAVGKMRQAFSETGVSPAVLRAVLRRPMALGMGRLTIRGMGPSVALVIDEGEASAEVDALLSSVAKTLGAMDRGFHMGTATVGGADCRTIEHSQGPKILLARRGGMFVATNSEGYLQEILAVAAGQQPSLAQRSTLGAHRARLGALPLVETFANTESLASMLDPLLPYESQQLGAAFGVQSMTGIYGGVAAVDGGTVETIDFGVRGPANGMLKAAFAGPTDFGAAAFCSQDTLAFGTLRCNLPATFQGFEAMLQALPDSVQGQVQPQMRRGLTRALRGIGLTPEQADQLLSASGGSVSFAVSLQKGAPLPEVMLILPVRDRQVIGQWIERGLAMSSERGGIEWKSRDADGVAVRLV